MAKNETLREINRRREMYNLFVKVVNKIRAEKKRV